MYRSYFSYNISRPYPFRWFTPLVVIAGILITIGITVLSIGTSGYRLVSISTSDPNVTETQKTWFSQSLGAILGNMRPECAPTAIPLNTVLYTNNTAFQYTLTDIGAYTARYPGIHPVSLIYHNNPLYYCDIAGTRIEFASSEWPAGRSPGQTQSITAITPVHCIVKASQGYLDVMLTATYKFRPDNLLVLLRVGEEQIVLSRYEAIAFDPKKQASLYWGSSLLNMYWINLINVLFIENPGYYRGTIDLMRSALNPPGKAADVTSSEFFGNLNFVLHSVNETGPSPPGTWYSGSKLPDVVGLDHSTQLWMEKLWPAAEYLSKVLFYTILTDLGQDLDVNMLTDKELLTFFSANFTQIAALLQPEALGDALGPLTVFSTTPYNETNAAMFDLKVHPSTFTASYLCQIPQLKSTSSLIVAVLVAGLVLLSAIWRIFKLITDTVLIYRRPHMRYCDGCQAHGMDSNLARDIESPSTSTMRRKSQKDGVYSEVLGDAEAESDSEDSKPK